MSSRPLPVVGAIIIAGLLVISAVAPAHADDLSTDPVSIIEDVVPSVLSQTTDQTTLNVNDSPAAGVTVSADPGDDSITPLVVSVDYAAEQVSTNNGLTVLSSTDSAVSAVVQPTTFGARVLTTIEDAGSPDSYSYTFDVPDGTDLVAGEATYYLEHGSEVLAQIGLPWAADSVGATLPTTYTWSGKTLTQHVDLTAADISFPVVADPAWGYVYQYSLSNSPATNRSKLYSCFNCFFPVAGAPRSFPSVGQLLPLAVAFFSFECRFKSVFTSTNYFGFQFDATKNHVDGYGSNIIFEFRYVGGVSKLVVSAYIVNDSLWVKNVQYRAGALANWALFARNLNMINITAGGAR